MIWIVIKPFHAYKKLIGKFGWMVLQLSLN